MADEVSIGAKGRFAVDSVLPFDASSKAFEIILPESLKKREVIRHRDGLRGTRSRNYRQRRREQIAVSGSIQFQPGVAELDWFLPYILGGTTAGGVTGLAETVPAFQAMLDKVAQVHTYTNLRVNVARLTGATGSPLTLTLDLEGENETVDGTFPSVVIPDEAQFVFPDLSIVLDGDTYPMSRFELTINNSLDTGRWMNSTTRSKIEAQDRIITLAVQLAYNSDTKALYDQDLDGFAGTVTLTDGVATYAFALANLHAPTESPTINGKGEIVYPLNYQCHRTVANSELVVTKTVA